MRSQGKVADSSENAPTATVPAFLHHMRVLVALIPCWLLILSISGRSMLFVLGVFIAAASFLYSIRSYHASLLSVVLGITACNVLQLLAGSGLMAINGLFGLLLVVNTLIMATTGAYLAILFPYIYTDLKKGMKTAYMTEKCLFVIMPILASSLLTWGAITQFGLENSPYWMLLLQIVSYLLYGLPRSSSYSKFLPHETEGEQDSSHPVFHEGGNRRDTELIDGVPYHELICDELLSYLQTIQLFLPLGLHVAIFWRSILFVWPTTVAEWTHVVDVAILTSVPLLLLGLMGTIGKSSPLWWARGHHRHTYKGFILFSVFILIPCLEFRVLFHAFDHLLTGLSRPFNYIVLALGLYAFVLSITLHLRSGLQGRPGTSASSATSLGAPTSFNAVNTSFGALVTSQMWQARKVSYTLAMFCALMFSKALGVPIYLWPATILSAAAFISFYFERRVWMYACFVAGLLVALSWFVFKSFFSLNFTFFTLAGWASIQVASVVIVILAALAASITGLIVLQIHRFWTSVLLILQAVLVAIMEEIMHMEELNNDFEIYPAYLVVITTTFGVLMSRKLKNENRINTNVLFIESMIYLSKLALLLKPVSRPTISAMLLLSPPLYLVFKLWDAQHFLIEPSKSNTICIVYVAWLFVATLFNRWTLFQRILELLAGEVRDHAAPALVHGLSFVVFGSLLPPLAWNHPYRSENTQSNVFSTRRRRIISFTGFAFIGLGFTAMSSYQLFGTAPANRVIGTGIMSSILGTRTGLPMISTLALFALFLVVVVILTGTLDVRGSTRQRIVAANAVGLAVGAFISPFALSTSIGDVHASPNDTPPAFVVFGICMIFQLASLLIAFADWHTIAPDAKWRNFSPRLGPAVYTLMWLQWPLLFIAMLCLSLISGVWRQDEIEAYNLALIATQAFAQGLIAVVLKVLEPEDQHAPTTRASWIPDIANIATFSCFAMALIVHISNSGSDWGVLAISPILVLFQRSGFLKQYIPKRNPYFFVYLAAASALIVSSHAQLWLHGPLSALGDMFSISLPDSQFEWSTTEESSPWVNIVMEILAQLAPLPSVIVLSLFLWDLAPVSLSLMAFLTWLSSIPIYLSVTNSAFVLGWLNVIVGIFAIAYSWILNTRERSRPLSSVTEGSA